MSACRTYNEKLVLLVYDELEDVERAEVEAHLNACSACRKELAALQKLQSNVPPLRVSENIMQPTRRALFLKLRRLAEPRREVSPWWGVGKFALQAGLAVALVFFGFKLGEQKTSAPAFAVQDLLMASRTISVEDGSISPQLLSIDKIKIAPDGTVEISYNTMNNVSIQGDGENPAVQQLLQYALLTENDPIVRQRAVKTMRQLVKTGTPLQTSSLEALEHILNKEHNLDVTLTIIDILAQSRQPHAQDVLFRIMLQNENKAVRIQAFKALVDGSEKTTTLDSILTTTKLDSNTYIRTKSLELLQQDKGTSL